MPQVVLQVCSVYTLESSCHKMLWKLYFSCKQIMVHYFWQNDRLIMRGLSFCNHIWGLVIVSEPPHDTSTSPLLVTPGSAPLLLHSRFPIIANKASWWWLLVMAGLHDTRRSCDGCTECAELDSRWAGPMLSPSSGRASVRHPYSWAWAHPSVVMQITVRPGMEEHGAWSRDLMPASDWLLEVTWPPYPPLHHYPVCPDPWEHYSRAEHLGTFTTSPSGSLAVMWIADYSQDLAQRVCSYSGDPQNTHPV